MRVRLGRIGGLKKIACVQEKLERDGKIFTGVRGVGGTWRGGGLSGGGGVCGGCAFGGGTWG